MVFFASIKQDYLLFSAIQCHPTICWQHHRCIYSIRPWHQWSPLVGPAHWRRNYAASIRCFIVGDASQLETADPLVPWWTQAEVGTTKTHAYLAHNKGILSLQRKKENPSNIEFDEVTLSLQYVKKCVCLQYTECISQTNKEKNLEPMAKNAILEQTKNFLQTKTRGGFYFFLSFNVKPWFTCKTNPKRGGPSGVLSADFVYFSLAWFIKSLSQLRGELTWVKNSAPFLRRNIFSCFHPSLL